MAGFIYPSRESIISVNKIVNLMSDNKADSHNLLINKRFIDAVLERVRKNKGDVYEKAAVLLEGLVKTHGFASGNKRTGFVVTTYFIKKNGGKTRFDDFYMVEKVLRNIRLYNTVEIAEWLRTGDIDESRFKR